jgi:predicted enzyme related to lactoylglutathione lyase
MAKRREQRKQTPRKSTARKSSRKAAPRHVPTRGLYGWITHTELASSDPAATKAWCATVLGWTFKPSFPTPGGEYHLFAYSDRGGGGIRSNNPPEVPGSIPYIHVADARASFEKALREGAEAMVPPERVMEGVTIAIVRAPGGVPIGFSGP